MKLPEPYSTISETHGYRLEIKKSIFFGDCAPCASDEEARAFLEKVRALHPEASTYAWAYSTNKGAVIKRFTDDGEPSGTAGMPILKVMELSGVDNAMIVVTRYFGGIKLGASGLTRAFTQTAAGILAESHSITLVPAVRMRITTEYSYGDKLSYELQKAGVVVEEKNYKSDLELTIHALMDYEKLEAWVMDITGAAALCEELPYCLVESAD